MLFQLTLNLQPCFSNLHTLSESQRDVSEIVSPLNEQENLFRKRTNLPTNHNFNIPRQ